MQKILLFYCKLPTKTAIAGEDPNWGRIVMGIGKSGEIVDQKLKVKLGSFIVAENERFPRLTMKKN